MNSTPPDSQRHPVALEEVPEPFRRMLDEHVSGQVDLMLYSPPFESVRRLRGSLLVITSTGWTILQDATDGGVSVHRADYGDTLLLELTTILLHGALRIDYVSEANLQTVNLDFNAVRADAYEDAVYRMLASIDGQPGHFVHHGELDAQLDSLPLKFHNAALHYLPVGRRPLSVVHWPACLGGNHRWSSEEIAPEAMLLLTDRELMLISEERARSWLRIGKPAPHYGSIVTYLPLVRLGDCRVDDEGMEPMAVLELGLHAKDGEVLDIEQVGFPTGMAEEISSFLERVDEQRQKPISRLAHH